MLIDQYGVAVRVDERDVGRPCGIVVGDGLAEFYPRVGECRLDLANVGELLGLIGSQDQAGI